MAKYLGRAATLTWGGAVIAGVQEKSIAINGEPIDVSDDDSAGWRELLEEDGEKSSDISLSGVTDGVVLKQAKANGTTIKALVLTWPDGSTLTGDFKIASYSETGNYKGASTFEAELQSTGAFVFAAA
jgi:TP901-1 family phage major tail protein